MNNKKTIVTSIFIAVLTIATLTATYAYFQAKIGTGSTTNTTVTAKTIDGLTFNQGTNLSITATQTNFASGKGNLSSSTSPTVTLKARNDAAANYNYKACLNVTENTFVHSQISSTETSLGRTVNLFDISKVISSARVINNNDGTLSVIRSETSAPVVGTQPATLKDYCPLCEVGKTYTFNANTTSDNLKISKRLGTRHRAALGISETGDSISLVVSEETGRLSIAMNGELHYNLTLDEVKMTLLEELRPKQSLLMDYNEEGEENESDN